MLLSGCGPELLKLSGLRHSEMLLFFYCVLFFCCCWRSLRGSDSHVKLNSAPIQVLEQAANLTYRPSLDFYPRSLLRPWQSQGVLRSASRKQVWSLTLTPAPWAASRSLTNMGWPSLSPRDSVQHVWSKSSKSACSSYFQVKQADVAGPETLIFKTQHSFDPRGSILRPTPTPPSSYFLL